MFMSQIYKTYWIYSYMTLYVEEGVRMFYVVTNYTK